MKGEFSMNGITKEALSLFIVCSCMICLMPTKGLSYDINEKLAVEGKITGVYQYGDFDVTGADNADRGAVVFDLGVNFHPTKIDEFQVTLSYAAGNGLNSVIPFSLISYADDLEDDLKDINGRNRDYLLEAWYKHTFEFSEKMSLAVTAGIIDATAYIDDNAFANDETAQFMNQVFVNHKNVNLPSYDIGGVVEFSISDISVRALAMNTKTEMGDGELRNYNYFAGQLGYRLETPMGEGNYRVFAFTTNDRFESTVDGKWENLNGFGLSFDQKLGNTLGVFVRIGWQDDKAVIDHDAIYSGGVNINGNIWGREKDEIGVAYAYLNGADDAEIDKTNAFEAYGKFPISDFGDVTLDVQYIKDTMKGIGDRDGFIYGIRMNAYF